MIVREEFIKEGILYF